MAKKKEIRKYLYDTIENLEGSLEDAIMELQNIPKLNHEFHRFELEIDWEYESTYLKLYGFRWETDKELASRLARAKKAKEKRKVNTDKKDAKEYKEYERLKKKFEEKLSGLAGE